MQSVYASRQSGAISTWLLVIVVFVVSAAIAVGAVFVFKEPIVENTSFSSTPTPTATPTAATSDINPMETVSSPTTVSVFFSKHPDSDNDFDKVFSTSRLVEENTIAVMAFNAVLVGPTSDEKADGLFSDWNISGESNCDGNSFGMAQNNEGRLTVKLCKDYTSGGIGQDARAKAIADATLLQFTAIKEVIYLDKNDNCLFDQSGQNMCKQ